jgi:hypothetical protein
MTAAGDDAMGLVMLEILQVIIAWSRAAKEPAYLGDHPKIAAQRLQNRIVSHILICSSLMARWSWTEAVGTS